MADFCKQCSMELFEEDCGDLKGLGNGKMLMPDFGWSVLCEGCGPTLVDVEGICIAAWCPKHGGRSAR